MVNVYLNLSIFTVFLKNKNIIFKIRRSQSYRLMYAALMISFRTEILHMHIIYHRLIYHCIFERLRLENKSGISCKIK